jgi:hypothetical protein
MRRIPDVMEHRFGYAAVYGEQQMQLPAITPPSRQSVGADGQRQGSRRWDRNQDLALLRRHARREHGDHTAAEKAFDQSGRRGLRRHRHHGEPSCMAPNLRWPKSGRKGSSRPGTTVAACIVDGGKLDLSSFTDEAAMRPAVQELLKRVNITQDPEYVGRPHRSRGGGHYWISRSR